MKMEKIIEVNDNKLSKCVLPDIIIVLHLIELKISLMISINIEVKSSNKVSKCFTLYTCFVCYLAL